MAVVTAISRGTGFLRTVAVTNVLGVTYLANTYQTANTVPNVVFELLAAGRAAMELPGADPEGPLGRGLAKLGAVLGEDDTSGVRIDLDPPPLADELTAWVDEHTVAHSAVRDIDGLWNMVFSIASVIFVLVNLAVDLLYYWLNPRLRQG